MNELAKIESFRKELALVETFEEIKLIGDAALAYTEFLKRQKIGKDGVNKIGKFLIEVEEKKGDWLDDNFPSRVKSKGRKSGCDMQPDKNMPINKEESTRSRTITRTPKAEKEIIYKELENQDKFILPNTVYSEIRKRENIQNRQKIREKYNTELELKGEKKYRIIYADPPWKYDKGKELSDHYGDVQKHYPPMEIEDICELPIKEELADKDCVLFLWATAPKLPEALEVMKSWGFQYKTCIIWDKIKHNFGFYFSVRHELLLIGGIGSSTPDIKTLYDSVISIERSDKHSEKPERFREIIDELYIDGNRIELFARGKLPNNWNKWGNE